MMRKRTLKLFALGISFVLCGCASIVHGTKQSVPVNSMPSDAAVAVRCDKAVENGGRTPVTIHFKRNATNCIVDISKEGYEPASVIFACMGMGQHRDRRDPRLDRRCREWRDV